MGIDIRLLKGGTMERKYQMTIPRDRLRLSMIERLERQAQKKKVPGFRPGKIPLPVLFRDYGEEALRHAIHEFVSHASFLETSETASGPLSYEIVTPLKGLDLDAIPDVEIHVQAFLAPEVPDVDWSALSLLHYIPIISEEEVDKVMEKIASENLTSIPLAEKRPAKKGDTLVYIMTFEEPQGQVRQVEGAFQLGSESLPIDFEATLEGIEEGHVLEERLRVPKTFPERSLAGKKVLFKIIFTEIRETVPHQVDLALAKSKGFETLEAMREHIRQILVRKGEESSDFLKKGEFSRKIKALLTFEIAPSMISERFQIMWEKLPLTKASYANAEEREQAFLEHTGLLEEAYRESLKDRLAAGIRLEFLLKKIEKEQQIAVSKEELVNAIKGVAHNFEISENQAVDFFRKNQQELKNLAHSIIEEKAMHWVISQCALITKEVSTEELEKARQKEEEIRVSLHANALEKKTEEESAPEGLA
jgi:trigger factor